MSLHVFPIPMPPPSIIYSHLPCGGPICKPLLMWKLLKKMLLAIAVPSCISVSVKSTFRKDKANCWNLAEVIAG